MSPSYSDVAQQVTFFQKLNKQLEQFEQDTIVIGGDFNCVLTSNDKRGGNPITKKSAVIKEIYALCDAYNLGDIWRNLNPDKQSFTWRTKSFKIQCRLDYFLVSQDLIQLASIRKEMRYRPRTRIRSLRCVSCSPV